MSLHISRTDATILASQLAEAFIAERNACDANWTYRCTEAVPDRQNPGTSRKVPLNYFVSVVTTPRAAAEDDVVIDGGEILLRVNIESGTVEQLPQIG